jgi:signal transduction histidine kinase
VLLAQILCALVLATATVWHEWHGRMHALDVQVAGRSDSLLGAIQDAEDLESNITIDPAELRLPPDDRFAVYSESGKLIGRSDRGGVLPQDGPSGMTVLRLEGIRYRVLRRPALRIIDRGEHRGVGLRRPVVMVYAVPETHVLHETFEAVAFSLTTIAVLALVTGFLTTWLLRSTLRPIRDLAFAAQQVSPSSLQFEVPQSALQVDELRPLATTLSALIDELREAFAKEQRFVGDAAHELKTAVAVVRSAVQLLMLRRRSEAEYVAGLEQLLLDNDRVEMLVASMLDLARLEQGPAVAAPLLDLGKAARTACDTMHPVAETQGIRLSMDAPEGAMVRLHPEHAETLVTNLLSNAIRHSWAGEAVAIKVQRDAQQVLLTVTDSGTGIRAEALPHVFERFYRDDPSRSRASGGTGLGLAICKSIVEAAGGSIAIESVVGKGTRVTVSFSIA